MSEQMELLARSLGRFVGQSFRKAPKWLLFLLIVPFICLALCGLTYWFVELRPQYVEFNVPEVEGMVSYYTERTEREWDDGAKYYLWRQEASCSASSCKDWETIWKHFDQYLTDAGWVRVDDRFGAPCSWDIPETEHLEVGNNGYVVYVQQARVDEGYCHGPDVCLAIWQSSDDYFGIKIGSINPSFLTDLFSCFD